mgnify:CR=1 FL=1
MSFDQYLWRWLDTRRFCDEAKDDIAKVLRTYDCHLVYLLTSLMDELGVPAKEKSTRLLPIILQQVVIHLADDIADGDCNLYESPSVQGVTTLCSLQNSIAICVLDLSISNDNKMSFFSMLQKVGEGQHIEISTPRWDLPKAKEAAKYLNGYLYSAYFQLVFANTPFEQNPHHLGMNFGVANHIATDIDSQDIRYTQLTVSDQADLRRWALDGIVSLSHSNISTLQKYGQGLIRSLL